MKVRLTAMTSDYGSHKLKREYIKAFNAKESISKNAYGDIMYNYEIDISSVDELFRIAKKIQQDLIISIKHGNYPDTVEIYDGYCE